MSGEDDFLRRWSRRKREAAETAKPVRPAAEPEAVDIKAAPESHGALEHPEAGSQAEFDPASLPPVESITSLSDITAFLRNGVPAELTRAALRRVWTADPTIRDFVGLAENAWDFTDPNAMPGFGPLEATEEVRRMIARVVDEIGQSARPDQSDAAAVRTENTKNSNHSNAIVEEQAAANAAPKELTEEQQRQNTAQISGDQVLLQSNNEDIASQNDVTEAQEKPRQFTHRTHGGALPQ